MLGLLKQLKIEKSQFLAVRRVAMFMIEVGQLSGVRRLGSGDAAVSKCPIALRLGHYKRYEFIDVNLSIPIDVS